MRSLDKARIVKNDEFYTLYEDVEKECNHYSWKGMRVYCNCDSTESSFWKYFRQNYEALGLAGLMITSLGGEGVKYDGKDEYRFDCGTGDFRCPECEALLNECDVVVTNPPFSLFKEFVPLLMKHEKKFLVIGGMNAIALGAIFPLFRDGKLWLGINEHGVCMEFDTPSGENKSISTWWYTNLEVKKPCELLQLKKNYFPEEHPKFDNYDAINVDHVKDIPCDYFGIMGVPITFAPKYNPEQFEILGITEKQKIGLSNGIWFEGSKCRVPLVNGKEKYVRIFIRRKTA